MHSGVSVWTNTTILRLGCLIKEKNSSKLNYFSKFYPSAFLSMWIIHIVSRNRQNCHYLQMKHLSSSLKFIELFIAEKEHWNQFCGRLEICAHQIWISLEAGSDRTHSEAHCPTTCRAWLISRWPLWTVCYSLSSLHVLVPLCHGLFNREPNSLSAVIWGLFLKKYTKYSCLSKRIHCKITTVWVS